MKLPHLFAVLALAGALNACSKNEDPENVDPTANYQTNLIDKNYIRVSSISNPAYPVGNGVLSTDMYADYYKQPCVLDDLWMFKANGDYLYDHGAIKCNSNEEQTLIWKWKFMENNTILQLSNPGTPYINNLKILVIDGTTLKYEMKVRSSLGIDHVWTETWKKI